MVCQIIRQRSSYSACRKCAKTMELNPLGDYIYNIYYININTYNIYINFLK